MNITELKSCLQQRYGRLIALFHNGLALVGLTAIAFMLVHSGRIFPAESDEVIGAFDASPYREAALSEPLADQDNPGGRILATYLSRRYRIANDAIEQLVNAAYNAGQKIGLDPLLILSVMAIESRFNPIAESEMGAKGLMQVMPQHHQDKLAEHGGEDAVLNPATNILVGAQILKECIRRGGGIEAGLQLYAGAFSDSSNQYSQKVMAEKDRLAHALRRPVSQPPRQAAVTAALGAAI